MPQKWSELSQSDEFKALPPEEQEKSRAGFFEQRIAPYADPERVPGLRKEWDTLTRLPRPAAPAANVAKPDANVAERQALARPASAQDAAPRTQNRTTLPTTASQGGQALQRPGRPQPTTQNRTGIDRVTGGSWDALKSGAQTTMANIGLTLDAWKGDAQSAMAGAMEARDIAKTPEQRAFTEALAGREETDSIWGEIKNVGAAAIEEPVGALHEVVAQTPNSGTAMAGMYAGAKMGSKILSPLGMKGRALGAFVGGVAGAMFGTSLVETGAITQEKAADGQLTEQELSEATRQGATKSAVIGTIDRLTMGVTGFMFSRAGRQATEAATEALARQGVDVTSEEAVRQALSDPATAQMLKSVITSTAQKANTAGRRVGRGATGMALESTSEGLGEYFGSSLAGLDPSVRESVLEGLMSMPQSTLELLWSRGEAQTGTPYDQMIADQERMQPGATPGDQGTPPPGASDEPATEPTPTAGGPTDGAGAAPPGDERPLGRVNRTGVDQLIDIARKMGFDEEATRLGTFKKVSALADRMYEEGNVDAAMRLHERAERIHRDIMGEDSSLIQEAERAGQQLPAVYTYEGAIEGTTDLATAGPGQQQAPIEGELYEEPGRLPAPPKRLTTDGVIYAGDGRGTTTPPADQPGDAPPGRLQRPGQPEPAPAAPTWSDAPATEAEAPEESRPVLQNRNRSTPASIEQMASIAANPDYTRLGFSRDFANGAPVVEPGAQIRPEQLGRQDVATTAGGRQIPVQYAVVEADQLLPSNRWDGSRIPEYEQGLEGASRTIAGNGRAAGLQRAYDQGNADGYREGLAADASLHGIPAEVLAGMQRPVLVRIMPREEITDNIGDESNTVGTASLSPGEQARNDTRRVDVAAVELDDNGEPTQTAVEQFIATMPAAERAGLMDGKRPNRQAYDRLSNAVFANAYESDELLRLAAEATDPEVRTIMAGLKIAAGKMSRLKGAGSYDIRGLVVEAAEAAINAKRAGESLREFITQGDMGRNPAVVPILEMMADNIRSAKRIGENLSALADVFYAEANLPAEDMFGAVQKRAPGQLLDEFYGTNTQAGQPAAGGPQNPGSSGEPRGPEPAPGGDEGQAVAPVEGGAGQPQAESGQSQEVTPESQPAPAGSDNPDGQVSPPGEFTLSGETEAEREAREKAEQEARAAEEKARREAEEKARKEKEAQDDKTRADETVDNFELGQSAEQQLSGQAGMFDAPSDPVAAAAADAATSPTNDTPLPTEGQIEAGNYKKGHLRWNGLDITIENPAGTRRRPEWPELNGHYGDIKRTEGADGERVDVFLNPDENRTDKVVVIDQYNGGKKSGGFDEHKVMLGYPNKMAAINAYKANYTPGWQVGPATEISLTEFKAWLADGDTSAELSKAQVLEEEARSAIEAVGGSLTPAGRKQFWTPATADQDSKPIMRDTFTVDLKQADGKDVRVKDIYFPMERKDLQRLLKNTTQSGGGANLVNLSGKGGSRPAPSSVPVDDARELERNQKARDAGKKAGRNGEERTPPDWLGDGELPNAWLAGYAEGAAARTKANEKYQKRWDELDYSGRQALADSPSSPRSVVHRLAGSRWDELSPGEQDRMRAAMDAAETQAQPKAAPEPERPAQTDPLQDKLDDIDAEIDAAAAELADLLKPKPGTLNTGVDPQILVVGARLGALYVQKGVVKFAQWSRAIVAKLRELGVDADQIKPHLKEIYAATQQRVDDEQFDQMDDARTVRRADLDAILAEGDTPAETPPAGKGALSEFLRERFDSITDNNDLKRVLADYHDTAVSRVTEAQIKEAQEAYEAVLVGKARDIVREGGDTRATFDRLVTLYQNQPNLNSRSSTSIANQAYSTPAPLAYLASNMAGINAQSSVYEPTAGNGMLLIGATPDYVAANELDSSRLEQLRELGFRPTGEDATTYTPGAGRFDSVIMNPPFGKLRDEAGRLDPVKVDGYTIKSIDHLIAARALEAMKDDGKAVMIIGADKKAGEIGSSDRVFFNWLYKHYNVVDHFEMDGKMYGRQGAGWPVRIITIHGRAESDQLSPDSGSIERMNNWNDIYEHTQKVLDAIGQGSVAGVSGSTSSSGRPEIGGDGTKPPGEAGGQDSRPGGGNGSQGNAPNSGEPRNPGGRGDTSGGGGKPDGGRVPVVPEGQDTVAPDAKTPKPRAQGSDGSSQGNGNLGVSGDGSERGKRVVQSDEGSEFQAPYVPRSKGFNEAVLVPANMQKAMDDALNEIEREVGPIDEYVMDKLGYESTDQLYDAFMALQVDTIAASIYNWEKRGKGIIIADQTGVGKGRQAAGMIRYAIRQGMTPVFVTVKPNLFTDMYDDLADIGETGVTPFIFNGNQGWVTERGTGRQLFKNSAKQRRAGFDALANGEMPDGTNAVFTTYSQILQQNHQRAALSGIAPNAFFVLDEAHNAAGEREIRKKVNGKMEMQQTGAGFMTGLIDGRPVTYLSATYAKRPDNMPVYYRTDIMDAAEDIDQLQAAFSKGGTPLQTVMSGMLSRSGQLFRRERSFDGIEIATVVNTEGTEIHERTADTVTQGLRSIVEADEKFAAFIKKDGKKILADLGFATATSISGSGNKASATINHSGFNSIVHNYVKQLLVALKADWTVELAIQAHKEGRKPVIALENTMGSFIEAMVDQDDMKLGDTFDGDYRNVLLRALERTRRVKIKDEMGEEFSIPVPEWILPPSVAQAYAEAEEIINELLIDDLPISYIDYMRHKLEQAGLKGAEITGRNYTLDYSHDVPVLAKRDPAEKNDRRGVIDAFNRGDIDFMILNAAGSTGLSIHASEKFPDQRPRHMIVAQAMADINILMQTLGRINRTGQVELPTYAMLGLNLPAEKRPLATTNRKLSSLNANTSANEESDVSLKVPDILNKYGDQVVNDFLVEHPEYGAALHLVGTDGDLAAPEGLALTFTGRLALMPVESQRYAYEVIEEAYNDLIQFLDATGQNDLRTDTLDLDAKIIASKVVYEGKAPDTLFGGNTTVHQVNVKRLGRPPRAEEVAETITKNLDGKQPNDVVDSLVAARDTASAALEESMEQRIRSAKDEEAKVKLLEQLKMWRFKRERAQAAFRMLKPGARVRLNLQDETVVGVVVGINDRYKPGAKGDPYALSKIRVGFMVNSPIRQIEIPLSKLLGNNEMLGGTVSGSGDISVEGLSAVFRGDLASASREIRYIATGNLIGGFGVLDSGRVVNFTGANGKTYQGILLPKKYGAKGEFDGAASGSDTPMRDATVAARYLEATSGQEAEIGLYSKPQVVRVFKQGGRYQIKVPKKRDPIGDRVKFDQPLQEILGTEFYGRGQTMVADVPADRLQAAIDRVIQLVPLYTPSSVRDAVVASGGDQRADAIRAFDEREGEDPAALSDADGELDDLLSSQPTPELTAGVEVPSTSSQLEMETWEAEHTQTGAALYMAKPGRNVPRDEFARLKSLASDHGGYWSRFGKAGFLFKSEDDRAAFLGSVRSSGIQEQQGLYYIPPEIEGGTDVRETSEVQSGKPRRRKPASKGDEAGRGAQFELFAQPGEQKRQAYADLFGTVVKARPVQYLKAASNSVNNAKDLAHLVASIRKDPQENFYAIATGKGGEVLRVMRFTRGTKNASAVYPLDVIAEAASVEGATHLHYAHNHPSGRTEPSPSDEKITDTLNRMLDGTGIDPGYHVVIGEKEYESVIADSSLFDVPTGGSLTPQLRNKSIAVTERRFVKRGKLSPVSITNPASAMEATKNHSDALFLLNNQHDLVAVVKMAPDEMRQLRSGGRVRRILSAAGKSNAAAAIIKTDDVEAGNNLDRFLSSLGGEIRVLDWIRDGESLASQGVSFGNDRSPFFSRSVLADGLMGVDEASRNALEIHRRLGLDRAGVGLEVVATEADLPDVIRRQAEQDGATGQIEGVFHNKTVYVVASSVRSEAHLEEIIAHEGLGHFGARKLLGKDIAKHYDQLFFQLGGAKGMRSRLEARGIDFREYLKTAERMGSKDQAFYLTDEFLAHMQQAQAIETLPEKIRRIASELYGKLREWARNGGMTRLAEMNDADLALLLRRMRQSATSKQEAGSSRPALIRASGDARFSRARHPFTLSGQNPSDSSQTGVTAQSLLARHWDGEPASSAQAAIREALRTKQPDVADWLRVNRNRIQPAERGDIVFSRAADTSRMRPAADGIVPGHTPETDPKQAEAPLEGGSVGADADWVLPGETKMSAFTDKWLYRLQNKQVDLKRVQQAIRATGREINEAHDAYLKEELFHGRSAARVNEFLEGELEPLIADMAARGVSQEELGRYLWARHAKEANAHIADINPEYPDGGSGMTDAEADAYMADLSPEQQANFEALAARVDAMVQKTRDDLVNDELISAQERETWESTYQFYVPLFRENEAADDGDMLTHGMGTGQGYSIKGAETKRRTGSALPVADILGNIANARDRAIVRGEKARVGRALYALALTNKNPDFWQTTSQAPLIKTHDKDGNVIEVPDPLFKQRDNVVVVKLKTAKGNVVERAVVFNKRNERAMRMAHAVKNLDGQQLGELLGTTASVTRYFAQINTQYNPIFGVVNLVRDTQAALVNLSSTPLAGRQGAVASNMASIIGGALKNGGRRFSDDWMALAKEFEEAGGKTGYRDMFASARERTEDIQKALDPEWWTKRHWGKALTANGYLKDPAVLLVDKGVKPVFDWLSDYNDTLENATRLAVYKEARDQGLSMESSASIAKNITTNFNRKGELALQAGALFAFFNAAVQGTARVFETVAAPAGKRILVGGIMVGVMQGVMMALAGYDDDEPPQFVRERNLIFPIPGSDGKYLSLAMPLGFHVLPNLGRLMVETVRGGRPAEKIGGMMAVLADAFNPLGGSAPMAQILAPTAADPFVALSMNEDWTGKPIAREDFSSLNPTPGFTRSRDLASAPAVALAKLLNAVTGGTDYRQGLASPTGDQIDYLVGQLTGGIGREAIKTATTVTSMFTADELPAYKIPLLGRFYGETTGQASEASRFYANIKRLNEHQNTVRGLRGDRKGNEAMRYLIEHPEARLFDQGNRAYRQVQKLRKQRSELADRGVSKARLKQVDQQITRAMAQLNERMAASG